METPSHTHKNDGNQQSKEATNNNEGRKHKQQGPQQKPQTQSRTTGKRQLTPKGMRNYTKTGTKEAQTTDNRTEGSTEENEQ